MAEAGRGLYEVLITEAIESRLRELDAHLHARKDGLRIADAADRIALHLGRVIQRAVAGINDNERVSAGVKLARTLIEQIDLLIANASVGRDAPVEPGTVLRAVLRHTPDGTPETIHEPLIPLLDTTLLTNAPGEPRVGSQLLTEIHSADRIDVVMAFIRRSGVGPLLDALRAHCQGGRPLRVLTTTYTGSTEVRALDSLREIGADVRVSYDMITTRLHAALLHVDLIQLLLNRFLLVAKPLLDHAIQFVDGSFGFLEVIVGQLAPNPLRLAFDFFPASCHLIAIHGHSFG